MENIAAAYDIATEFPTQWNESRSDDTSTTVGTTSKNVLINQLITDLKSSEHTSTSDELDPLGSGHRVLETMRSKGIDVEGLGDERAIFLPSSTKFNALSFLNAVHGDSDGAELESKLMYLKNSMSRKSKQQVNVDEDYEQFVTSKEQLDQVFNMISGKTNEGLQVSNLSGHIDETRRQYTQLMRPLEYSTNIRDRLQSAYDMVKHYRYVLTVPHILEQHVQNHEHDEFVRDWRAGSDYLTELKQSSKSPDCQKIADVVEKKVQKIVECYRNSLWEQLMQTQVDKLYSRYLGMLADLEVASNPLYEWMKHQVNQIHDSLGKFLEYEMHNLANLRRYDRVKDLQGSAVGYIKKLESGSTDLDSYDTIEHWILFQQVFGSLNEHVMKIMAFWKECKQIVSGRKAVANLKLESSQETELRKQFARTIEQISAAVKSLVGNNQASLGAYTPLNANSLSTAKHFNQVLVVLLGMEAEIHEPIFSDTLAQVRGLFVNIVCSSWLDDSKNLGQLQNFRKHDAAKGLESKTKYFGTYHKWVLREIHTLYPKGSKQIDSTLMAVLRTSMESYKQYLGEFSGTTVDYSGLSAELIEKEVRLLITINNLDYIKEHSIPEIYQLYSELFPGVGNPQVQLGTLEEACNELIRDLFRIFSQNKRSQINRIVSDGMKSKGSKWNQNQDPEKISQHIYEALMLLVEIEAEFSLYAPSFIGSIFSDLYYDLLMALLNGVREFDQLGQLGTLQLVADIEFTTEIMATIHSKEDQKVLAQLHSSIQEISGQSLYSDRDSPATRVSALVEWALEEEKIVFACFKSVSTHE